jgi:hypothetical protein
MTESDKELIGVNSNINMERHLLNIDIKRSPRELLEYASYLSKKDLSLLDNVIDKMETFKSSENEKIDFLIKIYALSSYPDIKNRIINMLKSVNQNEVQDALEKNSENADPHIRKDAEEILHGLEIID